MKLRVLEVAIPAEGLYTGVNIRTPLQKGLLWPSLQVTCSWGKAVRECSSGPGRLRRYCHFGPLDTALSEFVSRAKL